MSRSFAPELVIAFVAPAGTSFEEVADAAAERLEYCGYTTSKVRLSDFLADREGLTGGESMYLDLRTRRLQAAGDEFRREVGRADALAFVAVNEIRVRRTEDKIQTSSGSDQRSLSEPQDDEEAANTPVPKRAYLIWSLKHPKEAETLRNVYGSRFVLISVYAPRDLREEKLAGRIAESHEQIGKSTTFRGKSVDLITTDEHEADGLFGQNVRDAYPMGDFFVDASDPAQLRHTMDRAIDIVFGAPFATPTRAEYGMFFAHAAGLRSAELGRQVGAAIIDQDGDVLALGTNEVPSAGGGQYWDEDYPRDYREFRLPAETSDKMKRSLIGEILVRLKAAGWIVEEKEEATGADMYEALGETRLRDLIEFGRAVHAELSAIIDAARRGVAVKGATMYVTTFPCHHCARHIIAAGIQRVVYIYPYPKSLAADLHGDAIQTTNLSLFDASRVRFEPFLGVAPRQYMNFFTMPERRDEQGRPAPAEDRGRTPRLVDEERTGVWSVDAYIQRELLAVKHSSAWFGDGQTVEVEKAKEERVETE